MDNRTDRTRLKAPIHGIKGLIQRLSPDTFSRVLQSMYDRRGLRVLDRDWDTLVIFDCARYDFFSEAIRLDGDLSKENSIASVTANFVKWNFRHRQAHDVVYLSANPVVGAEADQLDIYKFVGMWKDETTEKHGQEQVRGLMESEPVLERARDLHEQFPNKRHIVHLLPPHTPHRFKDGRELPVDSPYRNYEAAREGTVDAETMRDVYAENLAHILETATPLIEEISGKIVLTSDHGELLGEGIPLWMKLFHDRWGNQLRKYDFGHYSNCDVPELREVPWFELPHEQRREIEPESPTTNEYDIDSIEDQLAALGYK